VLKIAAPRTLQEASVTRKIGLSILTLLVAFCVGLSLWAVAGAVVIVFF
jgi:hypothetical protein